MPKENEVKTRKTIHQNPALVIHNGEFNHFDDKEAAEKFVASKLEVGEKAQVFLLYKTFELKQTVVNKLESK